MTIVCQKSHREISALFTHLTTISTVYRYLGGDVAFFMTPILYSL